MLRHSETRISPYTASQIMDLIIDVEKYPEFLPWCINSRILKKYNQDEFDAELTIGYKNLRQRYTSRIKINYTSNTIDVYAIRGPFSCLRNLWQFKPMNNGCSITFNLDFEFKSMILSSLMKAFFCKAVKAMVDSFEKRAYLMYNKPQLQSATFK